MIVTLQYQYSAAPVAEIVQKLVRLAINTIDAQIHRCNTNDDTLDPASTYYPKNRSRGKHHASCSLNIN